MTEAVASGFDLEWVIDLDLLSFDALMASIYRTKYKNMLLTINAARVAQADEKGYKKSIKSIEKEAALPGVNPATHSGRDMVAEFGNGF